MQGLFREFPRMHPLVIKALYEETNQDIDFTRKAIYDLLGIEQVAPQLLMEHHTKRDLVDCSGSLVCEMSADLSMSNGYPEQFRKRFGQLYVRIEPLVVKQSLDGTFIYYLFTKERYFKDAYTEDIERCLTLLQEHVIKNNVYELSMHQMGDWNRVKGIVVDLFKDTTIRKINVFSM